MFERPFGVPDIELNVPAPPSVNKTRRIDPAGHRELKRWHKSADGFVMAAWAGGRRPNEPLDKFEAVIVFDENAVGLDLDNGVKHLIDYARRLGLIANDDKRYLRRLVVQWGYAPQGCRLILKPWEWGA